MGCDVVSLCSGVGGIDLGLQRAGWRIAGQVEIDPYCNAVLSKHWPEVPRWHDLTTVDPADILARIGGPVDLVAAGPPCQPISSAGKGLADADPRWLWPHVGRLLGALRPRWVLLENPAALLARGRGFGQVLRTLAEAGLDAEWCCIRASDVGAPHRRDRVWIVAYPARDRPQGFIADRAAVRAALRNGLAVAGTDGLERQRAGEPGELGGAPAAQPRQGLQRQRAGDAARRGGAPVGDPEVLRRGRPRLSQGEPGRTPEPRGSGAVGAQSVLVRILDGLPGRVDGHRWPAPPDPQHGSPQHEWEPPRTVRPRQVPYRARRVSALGNAVVPQIPELIGRALLAADLEAGAA